MSVELPPAVIEVGLRVAVDPVGEPLAVRLTVPAEPLATAVLIVEVPLLPCWMLRVVGLALIEKSGGGPQLENLNEAMRVFQLNAPSDVMYWLVYQKVQSSDGSIDMLV